MIGALLVALQFTAIAVLLWPSGAGINALALTLIVTGALFGAWAVASNRPGNFNIRPHPKTGGELIVHGAYRHVRHPMYVALLVAGAGLVVRDAQAWRVVAYAALIVVLHVKARVEERAMRERHPGYAAYCARTPRWVPFLARSRSH